MQTRDYIEIILSTLLGLGVCAGGFGYLYGKWLEGRNKEKLDTVKILRDDVDVLTGKVTELMAIVSNLRKEIADKDEKLGSALAILQGRNPEMEKFIISMTQYMEDNKPFLENIKMRVIPVVMKLDKFLDGKELK